MASPNPTETSSTEETFSVAQSLQAIQSTLASHPTNALPHPTTISTAASKIHSFLPAQGLGPSATLTHILEDLRPGFNGSKTSPNYYGFVTGGVLPIAEAADHVVTTWDQNVQVSSPIQPITQDL